MRLPLRFPTFRQTAIAAVPVALFGFTLANAQAAPKTVRRGAPPQVTRPTVATTPVSYNRDIRPILSEACFKCHGFDGASRKANLRLDIAEGALAKMKSGATPIVPGKPEQSEIMRRLLATNALQMPPVASGHKVSPQQIDTIRRWIAQGAKYEGHWAFISPKRPALPAVRNTGWPLNAIDRFVLARLEKEGLKPSPIADRPTLIRRISFDLTGLPPTPQEIDAFLNDKAPGAYERVVDRILASPHYGERMALKWLDLARYADTHGYHIDSGRDMWRWRDWVIDAYNKNKPFDQFTIEQLAGDLLPDATLDQKIATGFNRNHPINFEGGAIPEEYLANYVNDRIDTTATTWMALTLRCSQCHDHKFDPVSQKDYYQFYAFFNNVAENGLDGTQGNAVPFIKAPTPTQSAQLAEFDKQIAALDQSMQQRAAEASNAQTAWETALKSNPDQMKIASEGLVGHYAFDEMNGLEIRDASGKQPAATLKGSNAWSLGKVAGGIRFDGETTVDLGTGVAWERTDKFSYGAWVHPTDPGALTVVSRMDDAAKSRGWDLYISGGKVFVHLISEWEGNAIRVNTKAAIPQSQWTHVFATYDGSSKASGVQIYVNGKVQDLDRTHDKLSGSIVAANVPAVVGRRTPSAPFKGTIDDVRLYSRELSAKEVEQLAGEAAIRDILALEADKRTPEQVKAINRFYLETQDEPYRKLATEVAAVRAKRTDLDKNIPTSMVMEERKEVRPSHILLRGEYDKKGEKVSAGVPATFSQIPQSEPVSRLALAKWLVSPDHPLTSRVAVNRFWMLVFGNGIVKSVENFGIQGDMPSHPELLDWLATEFIRTGWDMKAMMRLIVTSNTYRQSSAASPALTKRDPDNMLLARGPRFRLTAEFIRDQALMVSGLLNREIGGKSVKPYQPPGIWEELSFGGPFSEQAYVQDHGDKLYRRSMYIFWKRTCPPPAMLTFDAPEREFCFPKRSVSNTPLQSLVLMNDITYIEAARKFGERIMQEGGATPEARIVFAYRTVIGRVPNPTEAKVLGELYRQQLARFGRDKEAAQKLLKVGESPRNEKLDQTELAAWALVGSVILNLDEAITKG